MTRFVKKYAGAYNVNKSTRRSLSENVKLIILSKETNFTITDNFSALFYRYLELESLQLEARKLAALFSIKSRCDISCSFDSAKG